MDSVEQIRIAVFTAWQSVIHGVIPLPILSPRQIFSQILWGTIPPYKLSSLHWNKLNFDELFTILRATSPRW